MVTGWSHPTPRGTVFILPQTAGGGARYLVLYQGVTLGSYETPEQAAKYAAGGHTTPPLSSELNISPNLSDWKRK